MSPPVQNNRRTRRCNYTVGTTTSSSSVEPLQNPNPCEKILPAPLPTASAIVRTIFAAPPIAALPRPDSFRRFFASSQPDPGRLLLPLSAALLRRVSRPEVSPPRGELSTLTEAGRPRPALRCLVRRGWISVCIRSRHRIRQAAGCVRAMSSDGRSREEKKLRNENGPDGGRTHAANADCP